jgi:glucose/arabinose dehydrogenase
MAALLRDRLALVLAVVAAVLTSACGGASNPPAPGDPGGGSGETITGRERIGWTQQALDAEQLATFRYAAYVDGTRRVLEGAACPGSGSGGFDCSAPLPPMTPGQHTIELVSFTVSDDTILESERSTPLRVTVAALTAPAPVDADLTLTTADGHQLRSTIIARGLDDPTDLAVAPDGRVFVTERGGRVQIVGEDAANGAALELDAVSASPESGLTSIVLDPKFEANGWVYLAYATETRDAIVLRIARFREREGILGQGALVARERADSAEHVTIRFGVDGKLYAGVAAGADPRAAQNLSSPHGKILRFNPDGTTPRDNPRSVPAFTSGHREPRGLTWHPSTGLLWEIDRDRDRGDELNMLVPGADYGWPMAMGGNASVVPGLVLPAGTDVSGASFVPASSASPFAGELLVASAGTEQLLRVQVPPNGRPAVVEGLLKGQYGRLSAVAAGADGALSVTTSNRETWGPGNDVVIKLTDQRINGSTDQRINGSADQRLTR